MFSLKLYRHALRLYPASHRDEFGEEMFLVFRELHAETAARGLRTHLRLCARETAGVFVGALREHWRLLGGDRFSQLFSTRRFTMHTEFRFPKATAVLMTIILGGVILAIQKGEAISASLRGAVVPPIGPIHPVHSVFVGGILLGFVFFYAAALIGWTILFAMRRSGLHRLDETVGKQ
ncbi:MAG TPA: hypothetical protein VH350_08980 [Candidatus Sulfotelmatobacter sp.]|jgi:hypothetical protein|nr:hypothetical protein [Candidatus Sulfotelmatobacter sp.]